jgi:hypothetical protein
VSTLVRGTLGERSQAGDADQLDRQRLREPPRRGDPDAQAREGARPHAHGDPLERAPGELGTAEQLGSHAQQPCRVARTLPGAGVIARLQRA